jgi:hypothetical protein
MQVTVRLMPVSVTNAGGQVHFFVPSTSLSFILGVAKRCFKLGIGILQTAFFAAVKSFALTSLIWFEARGRVGAARIAHAVQLALRSGI